MDFISAILDSVAKSKKDIKLSSSLPSSSSNNLKGLEQEFSKMKNGLLNTQAKLRETKASSSSGWRLDPYKERGVSSNQTKGGKKRKKKSK